MSTKRKPASEVTIRLGDLFEGLPDDTHKAAEFFSRIMRDMPPADKLDKEDCEGMRNFMFRTFMIVFISLLNETAHSPTGGPRGPRLPDGVTTLHLLPHLSEARRALASREIPFEQWVREHQWPGGMKVHPNTVRGWLTRYAKQITAYEPTDAQGRPATKSPKIGTH